ncbi:MAG: GNAT family N-acetyltransferase [Candidatus Promineifilaceae bacterium]|nr:GNAT family N-acetyltransferase [Candidatus Promineifilaceae bacterium]
MNLRILPLSEEQVRDFLTWEYQESYAIYNMSSEEGEETISFFLDPENGYFSIVDESGKLLGYCNFGADAQVPGGDYDEEALDIGMGMRPDLTGKGQGKAYAQAVFNFAKKRYPVMRQRVTIAEFNHRAQRLCANMGFHPVARFAKKDDGRPFIIMVRKSDPRAG